MAWSALSPRSPAAQLLAFWATGLLGLLACGVKAGHARAVTSARATILAQQLAGACAPHASSRPFDMIERTRCLTELFSTYISYKNRLVVGTRSSYFSSPPPLIIDADFLGSRPLTNGASPCTRYAPLSLVLFSSALHWPTLAAASIALVASYSMFCTVAGSMADHGSVRKTGPRPLPPASASPRVGALTSARSLPVVHRTGQTKPGMLAVPLNFCPDLTSFISIPFVMNVCMRCILCNDFGTEFEVSSTNLGSRAILSL